MEGRGQGEHVVEIPGHSGEAAAMRQALGLYRQDDVRANADKTDPSPDGEESGRAVEHRFAGHRFGPGEQIDNPAEQHRLCELEGHHHEIGEHETRHDCPILP